MVWRICASSAGSRNVADFDRNAGFFMLNMLWAGMMAAGIFWAAFHGNMGEVTNGLLDSAKEAVTLGVRRPAMTGKGFTPAGENRVAIRYGMP